MIYVTNLDLINDNGYTKLVSFCQVDLKILSKKPNSDMNQGPLPCCKFAKKHTTIYNTNKNLVNDDVYAKFGLILSICSQDIE